MNRRKLFGFLGGIGAAVISGKAMASTDPLTIARARITDLSVGTLRVGERSGEFFMPLGKMLRVTISDEVHHMASANGRLMFDVVRIEA